MHGMRGYLGPRVKVDGALGARISGIGDVMGAMDLRSAERERRLKARFTVLETAHSRTGGGPGARGARAGAGRAARRG